MNFYIVSVSALDFSVPYIKYVFLFAKQHKRHIKVCVMKHWISSLFYLGIWKKNRKRIGRKNGTVTKWVKYLVDKRLDTIVIFCLFLTNFTNCLFYQSGIGIYPSNNASNVSKYGVFSSLYFAVFGLNTEIHGVTFHIQSEHRIIRTRKTPYWNTFHAVQFTETVWQE